MTDSDTIDPSYRTERKIIQFIVDEYKSKGDRGAGMVIPVPYLESGSYSHKVSGTECTVTCKWTKKQFVVEVPRGADLFIDIPFSSPRAVLRQRNGNFKKFLYAQLAIEDAPPQVAIQNVQVNFGTPEPVVPGPATSGGAKGKRQSVTCSETAKVSKESAVATLSMFCAPPKAEQTTLKQMFFGGRANLEPSAASGSKRGAKGEQKDINIIYLEKGNKKKKGKTDSTIMVPRPNSCTF